MDNYKPQEGTWVLTAPDGTSFSAEHPLKCIRAEMEKRIPVEVRVQRLSDALNEPDEEIETLKKLLRGSLEWLDTIEPNPQLCELREAIKKELNIQ